MRPYKHSRVRGVLLVMVVAVMAILAALATGFYTMTLSQSRAATSYADSVRADLLAKGGISDAIARMRAQAFQNTEDPADQWFTVDYLHGAAESISFAPDDPSSTTVPKARLPYTNAMGSTAGTNSDRYSLSISDAASKINVNAGDNLAVILDNLCNAIGPPLVAADPDYLQPRRWAAEGADPALYAPAYDPGVPASVQDNQNNRDIYYALGADGRPLSFSTGPDAGRAIYGDGYAIAGYRARNGRFMRLEDVAKALTYVKRGNSGLEELEVAVKFAALKPYITIVSWVDTNTVCVGKFEWIGSGSGGSMIAIDRDKSWVPSVDANNNHINDPENTRGSLCGCYLSIVNGHGSGQLRRIKENGIDWLEVENGFVVPPGPISSYMIVAREAALLTTLPGVSPPTQIPQTNPDGSLVADPNIDYAHRPLCIHRAPVNINTASDKVLEALFMGINVQHGHYMAVGTTAPLGPGDAILPDVRDATGTSWIATDYATRWPSLASAKGIEAYMLTYQGLKRIPVSSGKLFFDGAKTIADVLPAQLQSAPYDLNYMTNGSSGLNEAHELAARVISARQRLVPAGAGSDLDPFTLDGSDTVGYERGPIKSWDDLYFRIIKPWDDLRSHPTTLNVPNSGNPLKAGRGKASVARMLMAHFNSNTDILKFNPNIEWIDRWGQNFTEMEPVFVYTDDTANNGKNACNIPPANPLTPSSVPIFARDENVAMPGYPWNPCTLADFWFWEQASGKAAGKGDGAFIVRSQRYKSDELIDKTDLNRSTTEFSFNSNGVFTITSTGQVVNAGRLAAEHKFEALVKLYDVWRESTQADFVNGEFSEALNQNVTDTIDKFAYAGKIARDGVHATGTAGGKALRRLAIASGPEPLVPLGYRLTRTDGIANTELVDPGNSARDAYGLPKSDPTMPDIVANHVLPARYDGQLMLAVNTPKYDPAGDSDTFMANFVGDLDTTTSAWNGREQAKVPNNPPAGDGYKYRVVDTIGLLGMLNDSLVDVDPDLPNRKVYPFSTVNAALGGLAAGDPGGDPSKSYYYNNVSVRMGDLRNDGVFLSSSGVSGRDATLKYLMGDPSVLPNDDNTVSSQTAPRQNYNINAANGQTISMWAKPTWHQDDYRRHEFFNASNPGYGANCRGNFLVKEGRYRFSGDYQNASNSNQGRMRNDLVFNLESQYGIPNNGNGDSERTTALFGGADYVPWALMPSPSDPNVSNDATKHVESPAYYVQPFRWHYLGGRENVIANQPACSSFGPCYGHWRPWMTYPDFVLGIQQVAGSVIRPFINSSLQDEKVYSGPYQQNPSTMITPANAPLIFCQANSPAWSDHLSDIGHPGPLELGSTTGCCTGGRTGQDVKWDWADPAGTVNSNKVFSINNLNYGKVAADKSIGGWQYRHMPDEGTYAVIDCLKISAKSNLYSWNGVYNSTPNYTPNVLDTDRAHQEMTLSRYYLPPNPTDSTQLPWFKSQTLSNFILGTGATQSPETVTVVRVTWTGFAPRFMHEYKQPGTFTRMEYITTDGIAADQKAVNFPIRGPFDVRIYNDDTAVDSTTVQDGRKVKYASVDRPPPTAYVDGRSPSSKGFQVELLQDAGGVLTVLGGKTFDNPEALNALGTAASPIQVRADQLRYRVRFLYPIDPLVDPSGGTTVNSATQYLLDSPVFDDVSITYMKEPRYLAFREIAE